MARAMGRVRGRARRYASTRVPLESGVPHPPDASHRAPPSPEGRRNLYALRAHGFLGRLRPGDEALAGGARDAVHAEAAGGFAAAIEAGDDLTVHVDDLAFGVDAQAGAGVVQH